MKRFACGARPLPELLFEVNNQLCSNEKRAELFLPKEEKNSHRSLSEIQNQPGGSGGGTVPSWLQQRLSLRPVYTTATDFWQNRTLLFWGFDSSLSEKILPSHSNEDNELQRRSKVLKRNWEEVNLLFCIEYREKQNKPFQFFQSLSKKKKKLNSLESLQNEETFIQIKQLPDSSAATGPRPSFSSSSSLVVSVISHKHRHAERRRHEIPNSQPNKMATFLLCGRMEQKWNSMHLGAANRRKRRAFLF